MRAAVKQISPVKFFNAACLTQWGISANGDRDC